MVVLDIGKLPKMRLSTVFATFLVWYMSLVTAISNKRSVSYTHLDVYKRQIIYRPLFKAAPEAALLDLEKNGFVTMTRDRGVLTDIYPAKPLFCAAFQYLLNNKEMYNVLRTSYLLRMVTFETGRIKKWEEELRALGKVSDQKMFRSRLAYLAGKIDASSAAIDDCESEVKELSKK